jgi:hypothetical protein
MTAMMMTAAMTAMTMMMTIGGMIFKKDLIFGLNYSA